MSECALRVCESEYVCVCVRACAASVCVRVSVRACAASVCVCESE